MDEYVRMMNENLGKRYSKVQNELFFVKSKLETVR